MPDPFSFARPGQVRDRSAARENLFVEAARAQRNRRVERLDEPRGLPRSSGIIRLLNDTDTAVDRGGVLGLDRPIFVPHDSEDAFLQEVAFRGVVPVADSRGRFAVLIEPAPPARVVRACVSGVCHVRLVPDDDDHGWADIDEGETGRLVSGGSGGAQILWKEDDLGAGYGYGEGEEQWAVVRVGGAGDGAAYGTTTSVIGASSGVTLGGGTATLVGQAAGPHAVTNWFSEAIPNATKIVVVRANGKWVITGADCDL